MQVTDDPERRSGLRSPSARGLGELGLGGETRKGMWKCEYGSFCPGDGG